MDSRQLRYFLAVVDNGSVTKAAEVLYVAQPALSQSLRALEAELGAALFRRVPRGMELTGAGAALVGPARQVVQSSRRVDETVRRLVSLERGWLDVACPSDLVVDPSASLIARFRARHPGVRINLVDPGPNADSTTVLRSARCEVAIDYLPVDDAKLATHPLGRRRLVLALPEDYETVPAPTFPIESLADLPLVAGGRGTVVREELERVCGQHGFAPRVVVEVEHEHNVHLLVAAGAGAAFVTEPEARLAERRGLRIVRTTPELGRDFGLVFRTGSLSPAALAFVTFVTASGDVQDL
ncbi:LysR family transcriptional regulator [Rhodococcus sp. (in: high G+C Gram-positive bacteria)]|uniref:LysR family transcriptional regulator n=1 Tax=Rhodococcus sp. TaxID=1831 RepID=UPI003B8A72A5